MTSTNRTINHDGRALLLGVDRYVNNGYLALTLTDADTGEPYCTLTVNIDDAFLMDLDYDIILDVNNCSSELLQKVFDTNLVEDTPYGHARSGFVVYPLHALTEEGVNWVHALETAEEY